jgi:hypothetical protein
MPLPLVLAGPIVRRVEPRLCTLWVALREAATVTGTLWDGAQFATEHAGLVASGDAPIARDSRPTRRFGERLHVAVVPVPVPNQPLLPGHTYSYDLEFTGTFGASTLRAAGLLKNETADERMPGVHEQAPLHLALGYQDDRLPSFVMPGATLETLNIVHTSCRRPSATSSDAMAWLDHILEETLDDTIERPQQLYLTGDQIYADDVGDTLLPMLTELGRELVGPDETLPIADKKVPVTLVNFPAARRSKLLRLEAKFSTGSASNHLLSFGEFAAMYLAVWSPRVWRGLPKPEDIFIGAGPNAAVQDLLTRWEACSKYAVKDDDPETLQKSRDKWKEAQLPGVASEHANVERFRAVVPRVARALANVATYMTFDDHEITDDWNISKAWINRVYGAPLGAAVVRNGLMAYGVFQGWGNDPAIFEATGRNKDFLVETEDVLKGPGTVPSAPTVKLDELLGLTVLDPKKQVQWYYQVPGALHQTVVLDTRTLRTFRGQRHAPPSLLGDTLKDQIPEGPLPGGRELLILVSSVPVISPAALEQLGQPLAANVQDFKLAIDQEEDYDDCNPSGRVIGSERRDIEQWSCNEAALEALLERLSGHRRTLILSGDVHFGASVELDYYRKPAPAPADPQPPPQPPARLLQLTSSPGHNTFDRKIQALVRTNALLQRLAGEPAVERIAWKDAAPIQLPQGETVPLTRLIRMKRSPALLLADGWPPGTTVPEGKGPDWGWRFKLARDERPNDALPTALRQPFLPAAAEIAPANPLPGYRALAARHAAAAMTRFDHLRTIVFSPHIAVIRVVRDAGGFSLVHTLVSPDAPGSVSFAPNTVHRMRLEPSAEPAPQLKVRGD